MVKIYLLMLFLGPISHPAQLTLYIDARIIPGKLGNELALPGAVQRKEEACSGANVPRCYSAVSENTSSTDQEKPRLKSAVRYSDAILKAHAWP